MPKYQVMEKEGLASGWRPVLYGDRTAMQFDDEASCFDGAKRYVTDMNVNNALTAAEKREHFEGFLWTEDGALLGVLDGKDWYLEDRQGKTVKDPSYFELDGKVEVAVKEIPRS